MCNTMKNFKATFFFRAITSYSKILNDKNYTFNTVENFMANSVFPKKVKNFSIQYIQAVKAITGTSRGLYKERYCRIEVTS